ncbi:MAG TPA: biotin--[acetyl-CoA-carboxylase] ligase [Acidimicrobiales bacterium]|nr:biotin--[acetyl-CoA-carboxylase] ligase [Acidimicrobiales bacterium]
MLAEEPGWIGAARSRAAARRFATIEWVAETGSTNRDLVARATRRAPRELVLVADHQTAGRGRLDRQWLAPPGQNLLFSVLARPGGASDRWSLATSAMAIAVADVAAAAGLTGVGIRWPNDVLVSGGRAPGKLAGVLAELVVDAGLPAAIVVGVGLNVAWPCEPDARAELAATSLAACTDDVPPREAVLAAVLAEFETTLTNVETDPRRLRELHLSRSLTVGREVRVARADGTSLEGRAVDIDETGRIVVRASGVDEALSAGDVTHLR